MRILVADRISEVAQARLQGLGHDVTFQPDLAAAHLADALKGQDVLIVRSTPVAATTIEAADALLLIIRAGAGVNTIDTEAAANKGIYVSNVPGQNAAAVAELTMGLILAIDRSIPDNVVLLRQGRWDKKRFANADGLFGRTIGIVGLGETGLAVAERAAAFGMVVLGIAKPDRAQGIADRISEIPVHLVADLESLAERSDIVTFHVPATDATVGIIGRPFLDRLRSGAVVINTSRGELIDAEALLAAVDTKGLRVGLDVYPDEPGHAEGDFESKLARHPNVYGTHHIGASTRQAQEAISDQVVRIVDSFARGVVLNCVNLVSQPLGAVVLAVRHFDEVGVLSDVFKVLRSADLNVEQMENQIFQGARVAVATMHLSGPVSEDVLMALHDIEAVIGISTYQHP